MELLNQVQRLAFCSVTGEAQEFMSNYPFLSRSSEFGDWSPEEISSLKEGLRKYGRAWGKIYREVGGLKTATQCKQFYDEYCGNKQLDLSATLAEHSSMKVWGCLCIVTSCRIRVTLHSLECREAEEKSGEYA